jgi:hypothetical protein
VQGCVDRQPSLSFSYLSSFVIALRDIIDAGCIFFVRGSPVVCIGLRLNMHLSESCNVFHNCTHGGPNHELLSIGSHVSPVWVNM